MRASLLSRGCSDLWRSRLARCFVVVALALTAGCAPKVTPREVDMMGGVTADDQQKIRQYLDAAGIKGAIIAIVDDGTAWMVSVGGEPAKEGGKPIPVAPVDVRVDKATGKVTGKSQ